MVFASDLHVSDDSSALLFALQVTGLNISALQQAEGYFGKLSLSQLALQKAYMCYAGLLEL